ncbi:dihydropteroate synthase [Roseiconus nitratireducens]|uniref:Dihydropteroate synthase n=1 Tax=Roseiconus nitratireducens TaxID=2605748 RepID=A0A5M6DJX0_9BACT|nr:DUF6513 domain-containing protein [Roseiconus nitratireducens]KAA5545595.1 dihydropteroate synthase [Roseiconus nitratireducens]
MQTSLELPQHAHLHFVTGKLAEHAVRNTVAPLAEQYRFGYSVGVMPITVAALMTPKWLVRKLDFPPETTHVILPGYCDAGVETLQQTLQPTVVVGPKDCRDLAVLFGGGTEPLSLQESDIEIIAEINHVPRLPMDEVFSIAQRLARDGAEMIDLGCDPATRFQDLGRCVKGLIDLGLRVSVDTFDPWEAQTATDAGASLVLSVNHSNRHAAPDWNAEVVAIPDTPNDLDSLDKTVEFLTRNNVPLRLDPILEPIGTGLAASLVRYATVRERYPELPMMMGIGNLTELTDVDSAGINFMLLGICQELQIGSVLTTEVINWARSSVRECDHARRLVHTAVQRGVPPKNMSDQLVMLRDRRLLPFDPATLTALAESIKDNNYRLFAQDQSIHLLSRQLHLSDRDPFRLFDRLLDEPIAENVDRGHAFYLGYEMAKASIALTLGKQYEQDRALDWGLLTRPETLHRIARTARRRRKQ